MSISGLLVRFAALYIGLIIGLGFAMNAFGLQSTTGVNSGVPRTATPPR